MSLLDLVENDLEKRNQDRTVKELYERRKTWAEGFVWPVIASTLNRERMLRLFGGIDHVTSRLVIKHGNEFTSREKYEHGRVNTTTRGMIKEQTFGVAYDLSAQFLCGIWLPSAFDVQERRNKGYDVEEFGIFFVGSTNCHHQLPHVVAFPGPEVDITEWTRDLVNAYFEYWLEHADSASHYTDHKHYFRWPTTFNYTHSPWAGAEEYDG